MKKRRYLYISGFGRSGSTIFEMYLVKHFDFIALGELTYFFERGVLKKELCSCGKNVFECEFWSKVIDQFGKEDLIRESKYYLEVRSKYEKTRNFFLYKNFPSIFCRKSDFESYIKLNTKLIKSVYDVFGDDVVIIDSSKHPSRALWLLNFIAKELNLDVCIVHIIRNPIANAYSWTKKKVRPETSLNGRLLYMRQYNYWRALLSWINNNIATFSLQFSDSNYILIKYEDFCQNPEEIVLNLLKKNFFKNCPKNTYGYHSISGNPVRFQLQNTDLKIKCDNEWCKNVNKSKKIITQILTLNMYNKISSKV